MTLDPQFAGFLDMLRDVGAPSSFAGSPDEMRERTRQAIEQGFGDRSGFAEVESVRRETVGAQRTEVTITVPKGVSGTVPTVVYFHPGGFVLTSADLTEDVTRRLARDLGAVVVSVDYRLSPEHPHPAPALDAAAVIDWVFAEIDRLGGDAARVAVSGESSGANLAAVAALHARDAGHPLAAQLLLVPVTDFSREFPSYEQNASGYFLSRDDLAIIRSLHYGDDPEVAADPTLSPALAADHAGVAPAIIAVAGFDPLRDDGIVYAGKLLTAGVPTQLFVYRSLIHPFFGMPALSEAADSAVDELTSALGELLASR